VVSVDSLRPMIAISGRRRLGGFRAAIVAAASSAAIGRAAATDAACGSERIHAPPSITNRVAHELPHDGRRQFIVPCLDGLRCKSETSVLDGFSAKEAGTVLRFSVAMRRRTAHRWLPGQGLCHEVTAGTAVPLRRSFRPRLLHHDGAASAGPPADVL